MQEGVMAAYVVLATFTDQGIKTAKDSPKRAEAFKQMAKTFGVTVKDIFWTQGRYDIVAITDAPDELSATALNLSLSALGNVRTESLRAFSAEEMAKITPRCSDRRCSLRRYYESSPTTSVHRQRRRREKRDLHLRHWEMDFS
jgi:uncharacterized protein with GYD domain